MLRRNFPGKSPFRDTENGSARRLPRLLSHADLRSRDDAFPSCFADNALPMSRNS
jgi:hypothetical protein